MSCLLTGGPQRFIAVGLKSERFEDHPHIGPMPCSRMGAERKLSPRHPFWRAVTLWYEQGKVIDERGNCVWKEPRTPTAGPTGKGMP